MEGEDITFMKPNQHLDLLDMMNISALSFFFFFFSFPGEIAWSIRPHGCPVRQISLPQNGIECKSKSNCTKPLQLSQIMQQNPFFFWTAQTDPREHGDHWRDFAQRSRKRHDQSVRFCSFHSQKPIGLNWNWWSVVYAEVVFLCPRLDMTQELMDCLDAALKMSDTGESAGTSMLRFHEQPHF